MKLRLNTFLQLVSELSDGAVSEACRRFASGECGRDADQRKFAPSSAEFCAVARDAENQIRARERPAIAAQMAIQRPKHWDAMQARVQDTIAGYRRTYLEAKAKDSALRYTDHVMAEFKKATGYDLRIPRPRADAPKQRGAA